MYHISCITTKYITQIVIYNLPMELHCIHCENLVQLGADAQQPIMAGKGHDISVCKSTCEESKDHRSQM